METLTKLFGGLLVSALRSLPCAVIHGPRSSQSVRNFTRLTGGMFGASCYPELEGRTTP